MLLKGFIWGGLMFFVQLAQSQTTINSTAFLQQRIKDVKALTMPNDKAAGFETAWIKELVVRTETNEFNFNRQSYAVRLKPNDKKSREGQKQLYRLLQEDASLKRETYSHRFLIAAYEDWLNIYALHREILLHKELLLVYGDIETVILRMGQYSSLNIKDFLEIQSDITNTKIALQTLEASLATYLPDGQPDFADLISFEAVKQIVFLEKNKWANSLNFIQRKDLAEKNIATEMDIAKRKQVLDFFQIKYQGPHSDALKERVSVGVGLNIPFSTDNQLKVEELKMEQALLREEFEIDKALLQDKIIKQQQVLKGLLEEVKRTKDFQKTQQNSAKDLIAKVIKEEGMAPLLSLYNKVEEGKQALDLVKLEVSVYENYINYLILTEQLFVQPFQNFMVGTR